MTTLAGDLKDQIRLILSQVQDETPIYTQVGGMRLKAGEAGEEIFIASPGDYRLTHEQILLLKTLYVQCQPQQQEVFIAALTALPNLVFKTNAVIHTLLEIGTLRDLTGILNNSTVSRETRLTIWRAIRAKLSTESHRFTEEDLTLLAKLVRDEFDRTPDPLARARRAGGI